MACRAGPFHDRLISMERASGRKLYTQATHETRAGFAQRGNGVGQESCKTG